MGILDNLLGPSPEDEMLMRAQAMRNAPPPAPMQPRQTPAGPGEQEAFAMAALMSGDPMMGNAGKGMMGMAQGERARLEKALAREQAQGNWDKSHALSKARLAAQKKYQDAMSSGGGSQGWQQEKFFMQRQRTLAKDLANAPAAMQTMASIKGAMARQGEDLAGIGMLDRYSMTDDAREMKQLGRRMVAEVIKKLSGTAASDKEVARLTDILGMGAFSTEKEFRDAVDDLDAIVKEEYRLARAGYKDFELDEFDASFLAQNPVSTPGVVEEEGEEQGNTVLKAEDYF